MATPPDWVFVWTWLPAAQEPIPAGAVRWTGGIAEFAYSERYLDRPDRFPLAPELPLGEGWIAPGDGLAIAGCLSDGLPDYWGQRVLRTERPDAYLGANETQVDMLISGTDRFGAIDFQESDEVYTARIGSATIDELHEASSLLEAGLPLSPELGAALLHGTSIGGARPKALLTDASGRSLIAKFSSTTWLPGHDRERPRRRRKRSDAKVSATATSPPASRPRMCTDSPARRRETPSTGSPPPSVSSGMTPRTARASPMGSGSVSSGARS